MSGDELQNSRAKVIAAAEATAKWVRARRKAWSDAEPPVTPAPIDLAPPPMVIAVAPPPARARIEAPVRSEPPAPPAAARTRVRVRIPVRGIAKYLAIAATGAAVVTAGLLYGPDLWSRAATFTTSSPPPAPGRWGAASPAGTGAPRKATGELRVSSSPAGARVVIDGEPRGVTPLTVTDLSTGTHSVQILSPSGTVTRSVVIVAGQTAEISEAIFSGWLKVFAPFDLSITEGTSALRLDDRNQVMLPSGPHDIVFANRNLGFEETRRVELKPGETLTISVMPPRSTIAVTATETAQVLIDGAPAGGTPLAAVPIDLGTHQVVVRSASGSERRFTVTITVKPFTLGVDFSAPR